MLKTVNRALLGLTGIVLLAFGAVLLTGSWPYAGRTDVLLDRAEPERWQSAGWWWPVVLTGLALAVLLALWWFLAQLRRPGPATLLVDTGDGAGAVLRVQALEEVMDREAEQVDGVVRARITLHGRRDAPTARVRLLLEPYAVPADALTALTGRALLHASRSTRLSGIPAEVRLTAVSRRARRVT
ncbi:alkaline shock response membrane anchor protein AmaP [Streptomyces sp. NPDC006879]|uniref:alkaline shock response membrane anchor protein AmaP n=1 Tax=Streptomyces sp. NPDC006879 TaxID=3364767 RepID=UPI0036A2AD80